MATLTHDHADGAATGTDWLLRLPLAATFAFHGVTKFPDPAPGAEMAGIPVWLWLVVGAAEVVIALMLVSGGAMRSAVGHLTTRLAGLGVAAISLGAIVLVHWGRWSFTPSESHPIGGMEFQTLMLCLGLFLAIRGNRA